MLNNILALKNNKIYNLQLTLFTENKNNILRDFLKILLNIRNILLEKSLLNILSNIKCLTICRVNNQCYF